MKKTPTALAVFVAALSLAAGCGNGHDSLSKVVGANPISDIHAAIDAVHGNGWSDKLMGQLQGELIAKGASPQDAACLSKELSKRLSPTQLRDSKDGNAKVLAAFTACGYPK